ncbi:MAG: hypothetical protein JST26_01995 [Bacteroidetes bacterium]|nr:hypothetical protein [Bacteroidota bacterium]
MLYPLRKIGFICMGILLLSSCAVRSVYVPTSQDILLFDDKKQVQANAYVGSSQVELQLAHNPVKHLALRTNIDYGAGIATYEGGLGTYGYNNNMKWRWELQAGAGRTNNISYLSSPAVNWFKHGNYNYETIGLYNKYYAQPAFGFFSKIDMYKINYAFIFSLRASYNDFKKFVYHEIDADSTALVKTNVYKVNREYTNKSMFIFEPCITNKVGVRNIYAVLQAQVIMPYSKQIDIRYTKFSPVFIFSAGIQYNFVFKTKSVPKA